MVERHAGGSGSPGAAEVVRRVFDLMPLMVVAFSGPEHRIVAATGAYRAWTGRAELVGMTLQEAFAEGVGRQLGEIADRVYATGRAESLRPGSGKRRESYVDWNLTPTRGPDGRVDGLIVDAVDITDRVLQRRGDRQRTDRAERRYAEARDGLDALQRELLPSSVPLLPGVQVAASYLPAQADTAAGGDWFEAFALPGGRLGLVVGDVVGHGVAASATMGQLGVVLTERLTATGDVREAVRSADAVALRVPAARAATVCVAALDLGTGDLEYAAAGHPPPLLVPSSGDARFLDTTGDRPLGIADAVLEPPVVRERLREGDLLLLYTDGVLERPGRSLAESTVELARTAAAAAADRAFPGHQPLAADRVCDQTVELLTRETGHLDDIVLLAAQLVPRPAELHRSYRAEAESMPSARQELEDWLTGLHLGAADLDALRHAVMELVTNAVEHAYLDLPPVHEFTVRARLTDRGQVQVEVADQGRWREPRSSADRGLGLQITAQMVDEFHIEHGTGGTTSVVRHGTRRPTRLLTAQDLGFGFSERGLVPDLPLVVQDRPDAPGPCIGVTGPVDTSTARQLERAVHTAGFTGTRSLTVDLTGVTLLASAGVSVLHRLRAGHRANGTELHLVAPVASPADVVLTLVGLDHRTAPLHPGGDS
ncbi:SpoIIE family protein phosphatase [Lentzea sp. NPDC003310]|uniref:SpoIIE family protein phosphatase n=1 Tax=Lentzea sp. NPDC003310 TaxID=3154447 RepID=UPI0033A17FE4